MADKTTDSKDAKDPSPGSDWEVRYKELEKKLGLQGKELGEMRKQHETSTGALQQYARWAKEAAPIVDWYSRYQQPLQQWWQHYSTGNGNGAGGQQQAAYQQAAAQVNATPGVELLTAQEKGALINQAAQTIIQQTLAPWTQQFVRTAENWGSQRFQQAMSQVDQRQKAFSDVMWKTLERILPQDKMSEARIWHDQALKYADPKNIDPLALASEHMGTQNKVAQLEKQLKEATDARERAEKAGMGSLGSADGLFAKTDPQNSKPASRDDRFKNVMQSLKETVGVEGLREQFPSL